MIGMQHSCNEYVTNAPIICLSVSEVQECAKREGVDLHRLPNDTIVDTLKDASRNGGWFFIEAADVSTNTLREAVLCVWLRGNWDHHPNFRAWFVYPSFKIPLNADFQLKENKERHSVEARLEVEKANEHLPQTLISSSVYRQYTDNLSDEFKVRQLVNAVGNTQLYYTLEYRKHMQLIPTQLIVGLFRLAKRQDIFVALAGTGAVVPTAIDYINGARDEVGKSPIDIAFEMDFLDAATVLRDIGCRSDIFDFSQLLRPSFRKMLMLLLQPGKEFPFDAKTTAAQVAEEGNQEVLCQLFRSNLDRNFSAFDYPLAQACYSGDEGTVWTVLDRMGVTGVNPMIETRFAQFHLFDILTRNSTLNEMTTQISMKLLQTLHVDGDEKVQVPLIVLQHSTNNATLMKGLLKILDWNSEPDSASLLRFFSKYDPENPMIEDIVARSFRDLPTKLLGEPLEQEVFSILDTLLDGIPQTDRMLRSSLDATIHLGFMDFTFRGHEGDTLLHRVMKKSAARADSLEAILQRLSERDRQNALAAVDANMNTPVDCIILRAINEGLDEQMADCLRGVFRFGGHIELTRARKYFKSAVLAKCGNVGFELFEQANLVESLVFLPHAFLKTMYRRSNRMDLVQESCDAPSKGAASVLTPEEQHGVLMSAGEVKSATRTLTKVIDPRLFSNNVFVKVDPVSHLHTVLQTIASYLDPNSIVVFRSLCVTTYCDGL